MAHDVFICHSAKNKVTADAVCAVLETNGVRCWIAPRDVTPGLEWGECIIDAIERARIMVLVFTSEANESPQIRKEVERAVNRGLIILPLRLEEILPNRALEYFIGNVHWLDALTPPLEQHLKNLATTIQLLLTRVEPRGGERAAPAPRASAQPETTRPIAPVTRAKAPEASPADVGGRGIRETVAATLDPAHTFVRDSESMPAQSARSTGAVTEGIRLGRWYVAAYLMLSVALVAFGVAALRTARDSDSLNGLSYAGRTFYFYFLKVTGCALVAGALAVAAWRRTRIAGAAGEVVVLGCMTLATGLFFAADVSNRQRFLVWADIGSDLRKLTWLAALLVVLGLELLRQGRRVRWLTVIRSLLAVELAVFLLYQTFVLHFAPPRDPWWDPANPLWWTTWMAWALVPAMILACGATFYERWRGAAGVALCGMILAFVPLLFWGWSDRLGPGATGRMLWDLSYQAALAGGALLLSVQLPRAGDPGGSGPPASA